MVLSNFATYVSMREKDGPVPRKDAKLIRRKSHS